jgi:hypothetical protein
MCFFSSNRNGVFSFHAGRMSSMKVLYAAPRERNTCSFSICPLSHHGGNAGFSQPHSARTRTRWNEYVTYCSATSDNKQPIVLLRERKKAQQHDASMGLSPVKSSDTNRLPRQGILPLWDILRPAALNERKLVTRERVRRVFWASGCSAVRCAPRP